MAMAIQDLKIYIKMTGKLQGLLFNDNSRIIAAIMINPYAHYIPCFSSDLQPYLTFDSFAEALDTGNDTSHLLIDHINNKIINWIEFYNNKRPHFSHKKSLL